MVTALDILFVMMAYLCKSYSITLEQRGKLIIVDLRCASSKHLQTRRYLDTLQGYLIDTQKLILQIYRQANERPAPFVDHTGTLRDAKTGAAIVNIGDGDDEEVDEDLEMSQLLVFSSLLTSAYSISRFQLDTPSLIAYVFIFQFS